MKIENISGYKVPSHVSLAMLHADEKHAPFPFCGMEFRRIQALLSGPPKKNGTPSARRSVIDASANRSTTLFWRLTRVSMGIGCSNVALPAFFGTPEAEN
jgi:hypothetical protein